MLKIRDDEVVRAREANKLRPVKGMVRTLSLVGTGAVMALASCGGS